MINSCTIMGLDLNSIDEICSNIKEQYDNRTADCALFVIYPFYHCGDSNA